MAGLLMAKRSKKSEAVGQQVATSEPDSIDAVRILEMPESCKDAMLGELGEAQEGEASARRIELGPGAQRVGLGELLCHVAALRG